MNFLPAIPLFSIPAIEGAGGAAVNVGGTLLASVDYYLHCVRIYSVIDQTAAPFIVGTAGTAGCLHGQFRNPISACFALRSGVDSLLICDYGNDRVVEVSASGLFLRAIALKGYIGPCRIAYCGTSDVLAVCCSPSHAVNLLQYESGADKREVTIGSGTWGCGDGQLCHPHGVSFTADGRYILVADSGNHRVSKFSAASGAFIAHVVSKGIRHPRDVLQCEDGSILVAQQGSATGSVVYVGQDGVTLQNIIIPCTSGGIVNFTPISLSLSLSLSGVLVKTLEGGVFLLRDAWMASSRCAWLSALASY
jgi:hypothetical protein